MEDEKQVSTGVRISEVRMHASTARRAAALLALSVWKNFPHQKTRFASWTGTEGGGPLLGSTQINRRKLINTKLLLKRDKRNMSNIIVHGCKPVSGDPVL